MVQTRRSTQKAISKTPEKKIIKETSIGRRKKLKTNLERCKNWIQQQKKEKLKVQLDELDSNESDEEARDINLGAISVRNSENLIFYQYFIFFYPKNNISFVLLTFRCSFPGQ